MRPGDLDLEATEIVDAAIDILRTDGLDAISMRSVSARLGVSPVPLYSRVGNKEALLAAVAERLLADLAPDLRPGEPWPHYAARWATELRHRILRAADSRLILGDRTSYVEASRPLIKQMRAGGLSSQAAVQACRLLVWATVGFVAMEQHGPKLAPRRGRRRLAGSHPDGVSAREADELFELNVRYVIEGIQRSAEES